MKETKPTFKNYIKRIVEATDRKDAIDNIFYGADGIDMAFQHGFISWNDHQLLLNLIEKLA